MAPNESVGKVVIAGPNGSLGPFVIKHLAQAGFDLTLFTRDPEKASKTYPEPIRTAKADYSTVEQLSDVLKAGQYDALVILLNRDVPEAQIKLIDAAIAAGIPHIIPSCFGIDTSDPRLRTLPPGRSKIEMEDYLVSKAKAGLFAYTGIQTGMFFDWALPLGVLVNLKNNGKPTMIFDGGDVTLSVSNMDFIAEAVAKALLKRAELKNCFLYVQSTAITQNQLLGYARELAPGREFETIPLDTAVLEEKAREMMRNGQTGPETMRMFLPRATFGWRLGLFERLDNELLGLTQLSEDEVKALLAKYTEQ